MLFEEFFSPTISSALISPVRENIGQSYNGYYRVKPGNYDPSDLIQVN